jgi:polysaccharide export outer membrane protein
MNRSVLMLMLVMLAASSCTVNRDIMFKTPVDFVFDAIPSVDSIEYQISPDDRVRFSLFTNNGYKLIDVIGQQSGGSGGANAQTNRQFGLNYLVERDGMVKLPTLGRINLKGLSIIEAEKKLEELYSEYYKDPFVQLSVTNNRVIVSTGSGGTAQIIPIENNMTVVEVLARAGGITSRGNASKVKVIRDAGTSKKVFELDLSRIDGIYEGDLIVQANDIVYVEPNPEIAREVLRDITPILTLITSTVALIAILTR